MKLMTPLALSLALLLAVPGAARAQAAAAKPAFDAELAKSVGADEHGMRGYVFVVLKTGPKQMPAGPERDAMFKGHFANIQRLADERKLVVAGPFDGVEGWRGMFVFAVKDIDEAKALVATDPVIANGEMVAEYHKYYGSAALMLVNANHQMVQAKPF